METSGEKWTTCTQEKKTEEEDEQKRRPPETYPRFHPQCGKSYSIFHLSVEKRTVDKIQNAYYNKNMLTAPDFEEIERLYRLNEQKFALYAAMLKEYNQKYNLTSITDEDGILYKHFYDSMAGIGCFRENATVMEVGSGGGFPSIPLKIVRGDLRFTLLESTGKKCDFLRAVIEALKLDHVEVVNRRAEEVARDNRYRERYSVCCARAVARLNTLAEYCLPFVEKGGVFLAYKGDAAEEVKEAQNAVCVLGGKGAQCVPYSLPHGMGERTLVQIEKIKYTPPQYPRGHGKERSKPL